VMRESLEEAFYSHRAHTFGYQLTGGVVDHRRGDAGFKTKTVGENGCDIKFTAAHVNVALMSFAKRDYTRIETMNQGSQRNKIERSVRGNVQTVVHIFAARSRCLEFAGSAGIPACITRAKYPQVSKVVLAESEAGRDACAPRLNLKQAGMPALPDLNACNSHTAEGGEAAINRDDYAGYKRRCRRQQPHHRAEEIFRLSKSIHRSVTNDAFAARCQLTGLRISK